MRTLPQAQYKPDIKPVAQSNRIPLSDAKTLLQIIRDSVQQAWYKTIEDANKSK